jgi:hypothetical protein
MVAAGHTKWISAVVVVNLHPQQQTAVRVAQKNTLINTMFMLCKGKAILAQARSDPDGSKSLRLPNFVTICI